MQLMMKKEVCAHLKISARTLETWVSQRRFPPGVQIGKLVYWSVEAVDNWTARAFHAQLNWKRP
jgi:predicted DNA-binding transcriptional regulator AlpA